MITLLLALVAQASPCSTTPPTGFVVAVGYGHGREADALRAAREDARARLLAAACAGLADVRCQGVARHIRDWEEGAWDPKQKSACATAAVRRDALDGLERDTAAFAAQAQALAKAARTAAGDRSIAMSSPTWSGSGCDAGPLGDAIAARVRNALAASGRVVERGDVALTLTLAPAGDRVAVTAALEGVALPGFEVPADVLGHPIPARPCEGASARPVAAIGTVIVDGVERTETHWIGACTGAELDGALLAANQLPDEAARARALTLVTTYRSELARLCGEYERFQISAETYARRSEELSRWALAAQASLLTGGSVPAETPSAQEISLEVQAIRADGRPLRSGDVVRHGDTFELKARASADAWIYVVYENSAGESAILPESGAAAHAASGTWVSLPAAGFEFVTDDKAGRTEVIAVLASPEPIPVDQLGPSEVARYRTRGFGVQAKPVTAPGGVAFYGDPDAIAKGYGAALWTLVLDHQ